jgi:predicted ester cyclase
MSSERDPASSEGVLAQRKRAVLASLREISECDIADLASVLERVMTPDATFEGMHPINALHGPSAIFEEVWLPLRRAFPDLERRDDIVMAGCWQDNDWVAATGYYFGRFKSDWLGIPATDHFATLRFGEFYRILDGRIAECRVILDVIDLMRQAGVNPLPPAAGIEGHIAGPATHDGVLLDEQPEAETAESMGRALAMFAGLGSFDGKDLNSMRMERYWTHDMMWYGPGGIGAMRGIDGFQRFHQLPFLIAFPDRVGGNHRARFADGHYVASTGWPSVRATHAGPYLGHPATNKSIGMRVMDFWRREGTMLREHWVFIDMPHLFLQFGDDLFARMAELRKARGR